MEKMFYPDSVAVVGASPHANNHGKNIVKNLKRWGFEGRIYPINPRGEDVEGLKGYSSILEIEDGIDLAVVIVPAKAVPSVMDDCAKKNIQWMVISSGGFSEYGGEGDELTREIKEKAQSYGIRFVGPNGLGIINSENGLCLPFLNLSKKKTGSISIISQSGGLGISLMIFLDNANRSFNKFISVGNKVNMDELDFLEYLGRDPNTKVICMFIESVVRGEGFREVASQINKPIIVYKANTTELGAKAAKSHTASLVNNDAVIEGVFRQTGVIRVNTIRRLVDMARAFELPPMRGNRVALISQAGGYTVLLADEACRKGFEFPPLSDELVTSFREYVRADVIRLGNPLDLGDVLSGDAVIQAIDQVLAQEYIDGAVAVFIRRAEAKRDGAYTDLSREIYGEIGEIMKKYNKPVAVALLTQSFYLKDVRSRMSYPIYDSPEDAVEALAVLRDYYLRHS
ncbi:MAG: CoA-binding protein [Actinomycetota bacterium]|nr:CoA-binding protein [Actinomycetota bacterium]